MVGLAELRPEELAPEDVRALPYVDLIAILRETNRCLGGHRTIREAARMLGYDERTRVLEVGCSTGYTTLELVKITRSRVHGIDVNPNVVAEAERRRRLLPREFAERVSFAVGDAMQIDAPDSSFDSVVCGGANSFIRDAKRALAEYHRVLRPFGTVSITNLYYREPPPDELRRRLEHVLGFDVGVATLRDWLDLFVTDGWQVYELQTFPVTRRVDWVVEAYADSLVSQEHLSALPEPVRAAVRERWVEACNTFNDNQDYLAYMFLILRRREPGEVDQPELFLDPGTWDPYFERDFVPDISAAMRDAAST